MNVRKTSIDFCLICISRIVLEQFNDLIKTSIHTFLIGILCIIKNYLVPYSCSLHGTFSQVGAQSN